MNNWLSNSRISSRTLYSLSSYAGVIAVAVMCTLMCASRLPDLSYNLSMRLIDEMTPRTLLSVDGKLVEEKIVEKADIDRNAHMNNARYIRALNFSRRRFFYANGLWPVLKAKKLNMIVQAQMIRHRKDLKLGQKYYIHTRIIYWNDVSKDECFYLESQFIDEDNFVIAIHLVKYRVVSTIKDATVDLRPSSLLKEADLLNDDMHMQRHMSESLRSWIESIDFSSKELNPSKK